MDNTRLLLFIALSFTALLLWEAWQRDYGAAPQPVATEQAESPGAATTTGADVPSAAPAAAAVPETPSRQADTAPTVTVVTDVLEVHISTRGGDLREADLLDYPVSVDRPDEPVRLLEDTPGRFFVAQSGLRGSGSAEPTHYARYTAAASEYRLADGQQELVVPLEWVSPEGVRVIKRYRFSRGDHLVVVEHEVRNGSGEVWTGRQYRQLVRSKPTQSRGMIYTYTGGVIYSPEEKYEKYDFSDMADVPLSRDITNGWAAVIEHYFLAAWVPERGEPNHYYSKALPNDRYVLGLIGPDRSLAPGESTLFRSQLYVGPKIQSRLEQIAEGLELTVDYGALTILAKPIFWLLQKIHALIGNWGWSIILLTLLIKLAFYKPSEMSYKSMAQMRKLAPRLQALKERYGDDKQKLNQAMMDLYRTEKINPLGGCLPILVQIPVFIALYWVLLESVELRQAPFILWIQDLSTRDPYFVLPLIMGVTMFIQQKLNPAPLDPIQAKVMMALPVVFTVMFAFFPSGLVLYWVTNNVLSIAQQWVITRRVEAGGK
ncbi:membrane protein insertase YidC [Thiohalobacter sp.]|uniref:membrane protein insertase YidC n=1 Tax=Thiohalobacter sp. TaxID=2025948 RepID=UPI0026273BFF|nr:membrane protein insertase YidC [Thiohalobacter sp.]